MSAALKKLSDYGLSFQIGVINSLVKNREFLAHIRDIISSEDFDHIALKWIVNEIIKYFDEYRNTPPLQYFVIEIKKIDNEVLQVGVKEQLKKIFQNNNEENEKEYIEEEFTTFCINQKLKSALFESIDYLKSGEFEKIRETIDKALKVGQDRDIGHKYVEEFEARYEEEARKVVPTPWKQVNLLLQGGLGNGDLGLIYGNPGGGKSWAMVAIACFALMLGLKVIYYTLELGEKYVGKRFDACLTQIPTQDLEDHKDNIKEFLKKYENNVIIKEYPPKSAGLHTIKSHIQKCKDLGFDADLILLDYIDLLKPPSKRSSRKEDLDDLYYGTKGLAKELDKPIWSVSQVNREGAKDKIIEGDKSAGSYDKLMVVDFSMSQSRTRKDKINNTARWHIMKNRYGDDGMTYSISADLSMGKFNIIKEYEEEEDEKQQPKPNFGDIDNDDKAILKDKFKDFKIS